MALAEMLRRPGCCLSVEAQALLQPAAPAGLKLHRAEAAITARQSPKPRRLVRAAACVGTGRRIGHKTPLKSSPSMLPFKHGLDQRASKAANCTCFKTRCMQSLRIQCMMAVSNSTHRCPKRAGMQCETGNWPIEAALLGSSACIGVELELRGIAPCAEIAHLELLC